MTVRGGGLTRPKLPGLRENDHAERTASSKR